MDHKDLCFLGLIALAYVYLEARLEESLEAPAPAPAPLRPELAATPATATGADLFFGVSPAPVDPGCPRFADHPISRRADGAIWCRGCDEAFYPSTAEALLVG